MPREHPAQALAYDLLRRAQELAAAQPADLDGGVRVVAESKAAKVASGWSSRKQRHEEDDLKGHGLPKNVQDAILAVEAASHDIAERVELAEKLWTVQPEHELALEPGAHPQTTWAQQFETVEGEIIEIVKDSHDSPVKVVYRPDLTPAEDVDPASALQARLQGAPVEE